MKPHEIGAMREAMDDKEIEREGKEIDAYYFENEKLCKYEVDNKPIGYALEDGKKDGLVKIQYCPGEFIE